MSQAIYDLSKHPTTFDFAPWVCYARTCGAGKVHFIVDGPIAQWKYPADIAWKRFGNILIPLCKIGGLEYSVGARIEGRNFTYSAGHLNTLYKQIGRIVKLKNPEVHPAQSYVTVTLRESFRNRFRNSNVPEWRKFIKYLETKNVNVEVFPECENAPIDLEYRMGVYSGATMNFGVGYGPLALCVFSEAPYLLLNLCPDPGDEKVQYDQKKLLEKQGFPEGSQFAFKNDRQLMVYEPDSFENIVRALEAMQERKKEAA